MNRGGRGAGGLDGWEFEVDVGGAKCKVQGARKWESQGSGVGHAVGMEAANQGLSGRTPAISPNALTGA